MEIYSIYDKRLLEPGWHPVIQSCYYKEWTRYDMRQHMHNRIEIMYVIKGECMVRSKKENIKLLSGDFIFIDYTCPHALTIDNDKGCIVLNIEFLFEQKQKPSPDFSSLFNNCKELRGLVENKEEYLRIKDNGELYRVLFSIVEQVDDKSIDHSLSLDLWLSQLILTIAKQALVKSENKADYIAAAKEYIHRNYYHEIHVSDIADYIHIHPAYLQRIFKRKTGMSVIDYLTDVRMKKAYNLLARTNMSIIDIANGVGINSQQYFNRLFKKTMNITPKMLRDSSMVDNRSIDRMENEDLASWRAGLSKATFEVDYDEDFSPVEEKRRER